MFGGFDDLLRRLSMDVTGFANALRDVFSSTVVQGKVVSVTMLSGQTTATVRHGLSRPAQGGAVISASAAGAFTVDPVTATNAVTVRASAAVGADTTIRLWVF